MSLSLTRERRALPFDGALSGISVDALLKFTIGIRVTQEEEYEGLDVADCGMEAYPEVVSPSEM